MHPDTTPSPRHTPPAPLSAPLSDLVLPQLQRYQQRQASPRSLENESRCYLSNDLQLLSLARFESNVFEHAGPDGGRAVTVCRYFVATYQHEPTEAELAEFCDRLNQADAAGLLATGVLRPVTAVPLVSEGRPGKWALVFFAGSLCDQATLRLETGGLVLAEHQLPTDVRLYLMQAIGRDPAQQLAREDFALAEAALAARPQLGTHALQREQQRQQRQQQLEQRLAQGQGWFAPAEGWPNATCELLAAHGFGRAYPRMWERYTFGGGLLAVHYLPESGRWLLEHTTATGYTMLPHAGQVRDAGHLVTLLVALGFSHQSPNAR